MKSSVSLFIKIFSVLNSQQFPKERSPGKISECGRLSAGKCVKSCVWEISDGSWRLKIDIGPLRDTLRVERYKSNKHMLPVMPAAVAVAVVVVAVVEEAERVEGWRRW